MEIGGLKTSQFLNSSSLFHTQGHSKVVSAVSMSKDGKLLVTFSIEENSVRFWQSPGGFFGAIVGALGTGAAKAGHGSAAIAGVAHMKMFRNFNVGPPEGKSGCFYNSTCNLQREER